MPINFNHSRLFTPLVGGIAIANPNNNQGETGTLGCLTIDEDGEVWLVSCHHVLCRKSGPCPVLSEPVQLNFAFGQPIVAFTSHARVDVILDIAAAKIEPGWPCLPRILGIGKLSPPSIPKRDMRVIKSGASTGITEGVVSSVSASEVVIRKTGFPADYLMSDSGDSGAIWVNAENNSPVAIHRGDRNSGTTEAFGPPFQLAMSRLRLSLAQE